MDVSKWSCISPSNPPTIEATIKTHSWSMTTKTAGDARLNVLENSVLVLFCVALYPVKWYKDGGNNNRQVRHFGLLRCVSLSADHLVSKRNQSDVRKR